MPQDSFFPWKASSSGHLVFRPIIENPTTINPKSGVSTVIPQVFTEWDMSPDGQDFSFKIRKGVKFHNDWGGFTVKDFIYNVDSAVQDGSLTGCASTFKAFMGAKTAKEMKDNGNLIINDDYKFTMHTARPQVDLVSWWNNVLMVPRTESFSSAQFEAEGESMYKTGPSGTRPYQFVSRTLNEFADMRRVPYDHWRVNPEFKTLRISTVPEEATRLAQLLAGEVDLADLSKAIHDTAINSGMVVFESPLPAVGLTILFQGIYHVSKVNWDSDNDPWALEGEPGRLVREAMNRAIDREPIINSLFKGRGSPVYNTAFHPTLEGWSDRWKDEFAEKYRYDPELAKQLLDEAGFPGDANGQNRFRIEVRQSILPGLPEVIEVAQTVAQSLQEVGIDAHIVETEFSQALDAFRDRHDAHFLLPVRQTIRPITANMRIYFYTGPIDEEKGRPTRGVLYAESEVADRVYEQMLGESDPDIRQRISQELGDFVYDQYLTIPVVNIKATIVGNPEVVEDYVFGGVTGVFSHMEYIKAVQ
jgi:ABC-type transport system substrate-binding protein